MMMAAKLEEVYAPSVDDLVDISANTFDRKEFMEFETTTKVSLGRKNVAKTAKDGELTEVNASIDEDNTSLVDEQSLLDKSVQEIIELQPACVETGMSYEDRVAKREPEIEALKEALCTLDREGPHQTEPECA